MKDKLAEIIAKMIKILSSEWVLTAGLVMAIYGLFGSHYWLDSGLFLGCVQAGCTWLSRYFEDRAKRRKFERIKL